MDGQNHKTRAAVRDHYGQIAKSSGSCCTGPCAGGDRSPVSLGDAARQLGYSDAEIETLPADQVMTLGCGNPVALATLRKGETVLDLGSGAGFDSLLAADRVGPTGRVIGVDMTPAMLEKARNAAEGWPQVEFRLGEIEHLPVADNQVDVIMSNCVINLSPEKPQVFAEAFRVLKPGGRLAISDTVALQPLAGSRWEGDEHISACISGSVAVAELEAMLAVAGFVEIKVVVKESLAEAISTWAPGTGLEAYIGSALIEARKP